MRFGAFLVYFAEQEYWSLIVDLTGLVSPTSPLPIVLEKKWTIYLFYFVNILENYLSSLSYF